MNLHLKKVGLIGSVFSLLCCLGFGPLISLLSAVGAGFLINDRVLAPLLALFLVIGGIGLGITYRRHRRIGPMLVYLPIAISVFVFTFVSFVAPLVWMSITGVVAVSVWDFFLGKQAHQASG